MSSSNLILGISAAWRMMLRGHGSRKIGTADSFISEMMKSFKRHGKLGNLL